MIFIILILMLHMLQSTYKYPNNLIIITINMINFNWYCIIPQVTKDL